MKYRLAEINDIEGVLSLQKKYQVDTILEDDKKDGFVTTSFSYQQLKGLIEKEQGLFVAETSGTIIAYVMAASWGYWSIWPLFAHMIKGLGNLEYLGKKLNTNNSYQYGPVCIDMEYRSQGVLESIFDLARHEMSNRYPILVTFINKNNPRSFQAHIKKLNLTVIQEFTFNNNEYYELAYDTAIKLQEGP